MKESHQSAADGNCCAVDAARHHDGGGVGTIPAPVLGAEGGTEGVWACIVLYTSGEGERPASLTRRSNQAGRKILQGLEQQQPRLDPARGLASGSWLRSRPGLRR